MARPSVEPNSICLKAEPGEILSANLRIAKAPISASVTASIANGDSLIKLKHVIAYELVRRPFTAEEMNELPPFPPSIREKARKNGIEEYVEVAQSDGNTPLAVSAGFMVQFYLEFAAPQEKAPDFTAATLIIEGTTWERVEIPLSLLIGKASYVMAIEPTDVRRAAEPGETVTQDLVVEKVHAYSKVLAHVASKTPIIQLKHLIVFEPVKRAFTEEEIDELPPWPPSIRENAKKNGYIEYREVGRAGECTPLAVAPGFMVRAYVEFSAPEHQAPDYVTSTLIIDGTTWHRIEVPLFLIIGKITAVLSTDSLAIRQGESGDLGVTLTSVAGPSTEVHFQYGFGRVEPPTIYLPRGETVIAALKVHVDPEEPLGTFPAAGLEVRSFERLQFKSLPFKLTVRPGQVLVKVLQPSLTVFQGDRATCDVEVISRGGYKRLTFTPGNLPVGVRMDAPVLEFYGAFKTIIKLEFPVAPQARPVANKQVTINWSAEDGEHAGTLALFCTVLLRLETRTFSQPIVTGAPLGGHVNMILQNDGNCRFSGYMRATGLTSYRFRLRAVVRSASGRAAVVAQKTGEVFGTDTPGDRQLDWDEPVSTPFIFNSWPDLRAGAMTVNRSTELTGVLGTFADIMGDLLEFVAAAAVLSPIPGGPALAGLVFLGSELDKLADVRIVGPGGLVGIAVAGGVTFLLGPTMIIPAFVAGTLVGNLAIKHRAMSDAEKAFAGVVFGNSLPTDRIILTNLSNTQGLPLTVPNVDGAILMNMGKGYDNPMTYTPGNAWPVHGQAFIHELTHAWQIAHTPFTSEYFWEAAASHIQGQITYFYSPPGTAWSDLYLEQQASIVDEWFAGISLKRTSPMPGRLPKDENDPYFGYIANNIRLGQN